MIRRIAWIVYRDGLEQRRAPGSLLAIWVTLLTVHGLTAAAAAGLAAVAASPEAIRDPEVDALLRWAPHRLVEAQAFLGLGQVLGLAGVQAGHAVLHDRQSGVLPHLLLAPIRRTELLFGKLLGATLHILLASRLTAAASAAVLATCAPTAAAGHGRLPPAAAWFAGWLAAEPACGLAVAAVAIAVSATARDARAAQQVVWFFLLFATVGVGLVFDAALSAGPAATLGLAGAALIAALATVAAGAQVLARDHAR